MGATLPSRGDLTRNEVAQHRPARDSELSSRGRLARLKALPHRKARHDSAVHSLLATLALAAGFGGALALARARRPLRAWRRASGIRPAGSPAAMWRRLYGAPETDPELEALRREARLWHGCAAACLAVALALSIAAALT